MNMLMTVFYGILANGFGLYVLTRYIDGVSYTGGIQFFVIAGAVLALLNFFVKPVVKLIALPLVLLSGGLVLVLINAFILWFLKYFLEVAAFQDVMIHFDGFEHYLIGAFVIGLFNWAVSLLD